MKTVTVGTYRNDTLYPRVAQAVASLLKDSDEISPVSVLMIIGCLMPKDYDAWRRGQVPYLERVIQGSLSKASRYVRILGFHAHELNMVSKQRTYVQQGKTRILRFSRSGNAGVEKSYAKHFFWNQSASKKQAYIEQFEALAKPLASPACGGRREGLCK